MTVFYFSSTGNSLYVAKRIGGNLISIPKCFEKLKADGDFKISDSEVGIIFPIYGLCIPPFIHDFIKKLSVECSFFFAVATYGFFPGAVCGQLKNTETKNGRHFDYINRLKMAENCITFSDMKNQKGDSPRQQKAISAISNDIQSKKTFVRSDSLLMKIMTKHHTANYEFPTGTGITEKITVNESCAGCGTCAKLCPMKNISIQNGKPVFGKNCVSCGACIQNCTSNAIHHAEEKSSARYRNPHISVSELVYWD